MSNRIGLDPLEPVIVELSEDVMKALEELPNSSKDNSSKRWTDEENTILLLYWDKKRKADVAEYLGVSTNTARKQYRALTKNQSSQIP